MDIVKTIVKIEMDKSKNNINRFITNCYSKISNTQNLLKDEIEKIDNMFDSVKEWERENNVNNIKITYRGGFLETNVINKSVKLLTYSSSSNDITVANGFRGNSENSKLMIYYILPEVKTIETSKISDTRSDETECLIDKDTYWTLIKIDEPSENINDTMKPIQKNVFYHVILSNGPLDNKIESIKKILKPQIKKIDKFIRVIRSDNGDVYLDTEYKKSLVIDKTPYTFDVTEFKNEIIKYQGNEFICINIYLRLKLYEKLDYFKKINDLLENSSKYMNSKNKFNGIAYSYDDMNSKNFVILYEKIEDLPLFKNNEEDVINSSNEKIDKYHNVNIFYVKSTNAIKVNYKGIKLIFIVNFQYKNIKKTTKLNIETPHRKELFSFINYIIYDKIPEKECKIPFKIPDDIKIDIKNELNQNVEQHYFCKNQYYYQIEKIERNMLSKINNRPVKTVIKKYLKLYNNSYLKSAKITKKKTW